MTITHESGPSVIYGLSPGASAGENTDAGPCIEYQGGAVLDPRTGYKPGQGGPVWSFYDCPYVCLVNALPYPASATCIASAVPSGGTVALVSSSDNTNGIFVLGTTYTGQDYLGNSITSGLSIDAPYQPLVVGRQRLFDPTKAVARPLVYKSSAADVNTVTVTGKDVYGVTMTETVTLNGTSTVAGTKAFKYITRIASASTNTVSVGTSSLIGFNLKAPQFEQLNIFWNDAYVTSKTGYVPPVTTTATATTGDVRGTYAIQAGSFAGATPDSAGRATATGKRFAVFISLLPNDMVAATPSNYTSMFGVTQA